MNPRLLGFPRQLTLRGLQVAELKAFPLPPQVWPRCIARPVVLQQRESNIGSWFSQVPGTVGQPQLEYHQEAGGSHTDSGRLVPSLAVPRLPLVTHTAPTITG